MTETALRSLRNAVLDLQAAEYNTYQRPLQKIARALGSEELEGIVSSLKQRADLDAFLENAGEGTGMAGSARLNWPSNDEAEMGLIIQILERGADNPNWFLQFAHRYYYSGSKITGDLRKITTGLVVPFERDFAAMVRAQAPPTGNTGATVAATSIMTAGTAFTSTKTEDSAAVDSQSWTGTEPRTAHLRRVQRLLPLAQQGLEALIAEYETRGHNGGPPLAEKEEALTALKEFHAALGAIIESIETGAFDDELGHGLVADLARTAKRTLKALRDDPVPYSVAALAVVVCEALGLTGVGEIIGGVVLSGKKKKADK